MSVCLYVYERESKRTFVLMSPLNVIFEKKNCTDNLICGCCCCCFFSHSPNPPFSPSLYLMWANERSRWQKKSTHKTYTPPCQASLLKIHRPGCTLLAFSTQNGGRALLDHGCSRFFTTDTSAFRTHTHTHKQTNKHTYGRRAKTVSLLCAASPQSPYSGNSD